MLHEKMIDNANKDLLNNLREIMILVENRQKAVKQIQKNVEALQKLDSKISKGS